MARQSIYSDMNTTTTQKAFLTNSKNKARRIVKLTTELQHAGVIVKQDPADADHFIVSTALTLAQTERKSVIVVGTDTDLLVMLISQCSSDMDIHMLCHRNPLQFYTIVELRSAVGDMKQHLMFVHAISGCDTVKNTLLCWGVYKICHFKVVLAWWKVKTPCHANGIFISKC